MIILVISYTGVMGKYDILVLTCTDMMGNKVTFGCSLHWYDGK